MAKILVVEDDLFLGKIVREALADAGHEVFLVPDSELAFTILPEQEIDLILLDVMIRGSLDGFGVLKKLASEERLKNIPVVMLSNLSQKDEIEHARTLGAVDYIIKANIDIDKLIVLVNKYLAQ